MEVNLRCGSCGLIYDYDVGKPDMDENFRLVFENKPVCPGCHASDKELLTELGQSQMTAWHLGDL